jgi:signal transduction histidine kinase
MIKRKVRLFYRFCLFLIHLLFFGAAALAYPSPKGHTATEIVNTIIKDSRGLVWLGGTKGFGYLQPRGISWFESQGRDPVAPLAGAVETLCEDDLGRLWMGLSTGGIMRFQPEQNQLVCFSRQELPFPLRRVRIRAIRPLGFAHLLVCTEAGAFVMNGQLRTAFPLSTNRWPDRAVVDGLTFNGRLYLLLECGALIEIQAGGTERQYAKIEKMMSGVRLDTLDGSLYVSCSAGICTPDADTLREFAVHLQGEDIGRHGFVGAFKDASGNLFLCSRVYGLLQVLRRDQMRLQVDMKIKGRGLGNGSLVNCILFDNAANDWFVGTSAGFLRNDRNQRLSAPTLVPGHTVRAVLPHAGTLYFSTHRRAGQLTEGIVRWLSTGDLDRDPVIEHIFSLPNGRVFGVGNNLYEFKDGRVQLPEDLQLRCRSERLIWADRLNDSVMYIILPRQNMLALWKVGSEINKVTLSTEWSSFNPPALAYKGRYLVYSDGSRIRQFDLLTKKFSSLHTLESEMIRHIKTDGWNIFFAMAGGVHKYDPGSAECQEIDFGPDLDGEEVTNIEIIGCEICYTTRSGFGFYSLKTKSHHYFPMAHDEPVGQFAEFSSARIGNAMLVGGAGGILSVFPDSLLYSKREFKVFMADCRVNHQGYSLRKEQASAEDFEADQNHVEFLLARTLSKGWSVAGLDYSLDKQPLLPVSAGDRILLHGIKAGTHTLEVFDRETHRRVGQWTFGLLKPWYQSLWFVSVLVVLVVLLQWLAIRPYLLRRKLMKASAREMESQILNERDRISSELHDDLGSGLSTIRLLTEMVKQRVTEAELRAELEEIIGEALRLNDSLRDLVWSLNPAEDELPRMIQYFAAYARKFLGNAGVQTEIKLRELPSARAVPGAVRRQLVLVFKELLNNVVKHSKATKVLLDFRRSSECLHIHLEDNGTGIMLMGEAGSRGIQNMTRRINGLGGQINWRNGTEGGTVVDLELPLTEDA